MFFGRSSPFPYPPTYSTRFHYLETGWRLRSSRCSYHQYITCGVNFTHLSRTDHTTTRSHLEGREPGTTMYCSIPPHTYPTRGGDPSSKRIHPFPTGCDRSSRWDPENHGETISSHQSWKYTDHPGSLHTSRILITHPHDPEGGRKNFQIPLTPLPVGSLVGEPVRV